MIDASQILARLIEIGEALKEKGDILRAPDIQRICRMVLDAQDLVLSIERESLQSSDR